MRRLFALCFILLLCLFSGAAAEEKTSPIGVQALDGEWEYDMNERLVIEDGHFQDKYMQSYLLDTQIIAFDEKPDGQGRQYITLADTETCENGRKTSDILQCWVEKDEIHLIREYVFGERENVFKKTNHREFYYFDIVTDEVLPELQGMWVNGDSGFLFDGIRVWECCEGKPFGEPDTICVVRENQYENGRVYVTRDNLYMLGICGYSMLEYRDGILTGTMIVMDRDSQPETFAKSEGIKLEK